MHNYNCNGVVYSVLAGLAWLSFLAAIWLTVFGINVTGIALLSFVVLGLFFSVASSTSVMPRRDSNDKS